jgi:hypothetical protein
MRTQALPITLTLLAMLSCQGMALGQAEKPKPKATRPPDQVAAEIDRAIAKELEAKKVPASPLADDAEFIRRATLDLIGRTPLGERAGAFLDSPDSSKRGKLVDELLASPEYGRHFGTLWHNRIIPLNSENTREQQTSLFLWLAEGFNRNRPWSDMVADLLLAEGEIAKNPTTRFYMSPANTLEGYVHADRVTGSVTELFLGVNLRCAQCHDHPFAPWKQTEFWEMAAFFGRVGFTRKTGEKVLVESKEIMGRGSNPTTARADASIAIPGKDKVLKAKFLGGKAPVLDPERAFRPAFVAWLTGPDNERFAQAAVNRLWHHFFGRGLVNPVNDMHEENASSHPEVLDLLTREFIASGHDQKHLIRCICGSQAYQRTSKPLPENRADTKLFSHMALRQMSAEALFDSLMMILDGARYEKDLAKSVSNPGRHFWTQAFADIKSDNDPLRYTHGVPQALKMLNSSLTNGGEVPLIRQLLKDKAPEDKALDALFLEALARRPSAEERREFAELLREVRDPMTGYRNVWWVLLNSSEFVFNH